MDTDVIVKLLEGRWVTPDKKGSMVFFATEEIDNGGVLLTQTEGSPSKQLDYSISKRRGQDIMILRKRGETGENVFAIESIHLSKLTLINPNNKSLVLMKDS